MAAGSGPPLNGWRLRHERLARLNRQLSMGRQVEGRRRQLRVGRLVAGFAGLLGAVLADGP
ncbi:hypothetical protein ACFYQ5_09670 [Streptomyces sp. NPDC005794]|uniref:hypothetical protein n=1 Tax=Streptomyces sp. NPDC005794 TaxID=3364733 RepID=UPI003673DACC